MSDSPVIHVPDLPFKSPKTDDQRDNELALERLNTKIKDSVSELSVQVTDAISTIDPQLQALQQQIDTLDTRCDGFDASITANIDAITLINTTAVFKDDSIVNVTLPNDFNESGQVQDYGLDANLTADNWNNQPTQNQAFGNQFSYKFLRIFENIQALETKVNELVAIIKGTA